MTSFKTSCEINAAPEKVFAAFNPQSLARWWGPKGFTNTFNVCDFKTGGTWSFVMHSPDGKNYPNENVFLEVDFPTKVIIQHIFEPKFILTIRLEKTSQGTKIYWDQAIEDSETAKKIKHIVVPANEENLQRLTAEVLRLEK